MKKIILASKSPDRKKILEDLGIPFEIYITNVNEEMYKGEITDPIELAMKLAETKAIEAKKNLEELNQDAIIIGADTIVEVKGEIIGKAFNEEGAFNIIKKLRGKTHNLITGIAITESNQSKLIIDYDLTTVEFLYLSEDEIWHYINTNEWKGRAGAYSIMDRASLFINRIIGSTSNVIGLPMHKINKILKSEFEINLIQI
ncbi:MAG: Maf family protein [Candidatus Thorarchaeota archaeon]